MVRNYTAIKIIKHYFAAYLGSAITVGSVVVIRKYAFRKSLVKQAIYRFQSELDELI